MGGKEKKGGKASVKKVFGAIGNVLLYLFIALCIAAVVYTIFAKRGKDGAVEVFGYEMRIVLSGSMEKNENTDTSGFRIKDIPVKSLIVTEKVPEEEEAAEAWYEKLGTGDVLTFRYVVAGRQETITHRIIAIEPQEEGYKITLRGDNTEGEQVIYTNDEASPDYVLGKVVYVSVVLGYAVWIMQQPIGMALVVIVPAAIIIVAQIVRIVSVLGEEKRKKIEAREAEKSSEIELLKKRLSDLEQQKTEQQETENGDTMSEEEAQETSSGQEILTENAEPESTPQESAEPESGPPAQETGSDGELP